MAEINSKEAALVAAGSKVNNASHGRKRTLVVNFPETYTALAVNDTVASKQFIPVGSRIIGCRVGNGTGAASSTMDVGVRQRDGTVVDADGIATVVAITTATTVPVEVGDGALIAAGIDSVTTVDLEVYCTMKGATNTANQDIRVEVDYIGA